MVKALLLSVVLLAATTPAHARFSRKTILYQIGIVVKIENLEWKIGGPWPKPSYVLKRTQIVWVHTWDDRFEAYYAYDDDIGFHWLGKIWEKNDVYRLVQ